MTAQEINERLSAAKQKKIKVYTMQEETKEPTICFKANILGTEAGR